MTLKGLKRCAGRIAGATLGLHAAAALAAPKEAGLWYDDSGKGAVMIEQCGDKLCGRIYWLKELLNAEGKPLRDKYNPNPSQQNRPICGLQVIGGLARMQDGEWDSGWIYDPKEGKSYSVALTMADPETLKVTGYLVMKMMGRTLTWKRAPADLPSCAANAASAAGNGAAKAAAPKAIAAPSKVAAPLPQEDDPDVGSPPAETPATTVRPAAPAPMKPKAAARVTPEGEAQGKAVTPPAAKAVKTVKPAKAKDTTKASTTAAVAPSATSEGKPDKAKPAKSTATNGKKKGSESASTKGGSPEQLPWSDKKQAAKQTGTTAAAATAVVANPDATPAVITPPKPPRPQRADEQARPFQ